jgi:hypothetical protein
MTKDLLSKETLVKYCFTDHLSISLFPVESVSGLELLSPEYTGSKIRTAE